MTAFVDSLFLPNVLSLIPLRPMYASSAKLIASKGYHMVVQPIFL